MMHVHEQSTARRITSTGVFEPSWKEDTNATSLVTVTNLISKAVDVAVSKNEMSYVPLELIARYGDVQLVRMRQDHGVAKTSASDDSSPNQKLHDDFLKHAIQLQGSVRKVHCQNSHRSPAASAHVAFLAAV